MAATSEFVFTAAVLYQVAYARAAGRSWRAAAAEVGAPEEAVRDGARVELVLSLRPHYVTHTRASQPARFPLWCSSRTSG